MNGKESETVEMCENYTTTRWPAFKPVCLGLGKHWPSLKCHVARFSCPDYKPSEVKQDER